MAYWCKQYGVFVTTPRPSDKHRTAEEVAENIVTYFVQIDDPRREEFKSHVIFLLTSYAAAKAEEAFNEGVKAKWSDCYETGYEKAVEEAAQVADKTDLRLTLSGKTVGEEIRALKTGRAGEGEKK